LFMSLQGANRFFYILRNIMALYFSTLLCISASQFTIKIAALLWFLLGVLSVTTMTGGRKSQRLAVRTNL
jgi:putative polymerase